MKTLSPAEARRWLCSYHFAPASGPAIFERLGSIQYDPLKPVGCNPDLVLQARVPGYRVDDWQQWAYGPERLIYDGWDKQASLLRLQDWPWRRVYHHWHLKHWEARILKPYATAVQAVLDELRARGPLRSQAFAFQEHKTDWQGSWYGPHLTKHILKALWFTGQVITAQRYKGQHVYDLTERVVPAALLQQPVCSETEALKWLICARHQAVGLLRPKASGEVWSLAVSAVRRKALIQELLKAGELQAFQIDGQDYHGLSQVWEQPFTDAHLKDRVRFLAPLDPLLWDRRMVAAVFGFDYVWEVYKPAAQRRWGYYVLPVLYEDRFVARVDSRYQAGRWEILSWHWEANVRQTRRLKQAIEAASCQFQAYLGLEPDAIKAAKVNLG